jgi:hypothetical protein
MKRRLGLAVAVAAVAMVAVSAMLLEGGAAMASPARAIALDATVGQQNYADVAPPGPSVGDVVVVRDHLKNTGGKPSGHDGLQCTVTYVTSTSLELQCFLTVHLKGGDLTAQGLLSEPVREPHHPTSLLAVTGGTGIFAGAGGWVRLHEVSEEETTYIFHLAG